MPLVPIFLRSKNIMTHVTSLNLGTAFLPAPTLANLSPCRGRRARGCLVRAYGDLSGEDNQEGLRDKGAFEFTGWITQSVF